ncbi:MAG: fructose 1,6-bisphosphatase [Candidatus Altiarchaeales archaeon]|nr:MAG: fructose 1,6-bisphosphatase [Candidatus Altiarchaeales archaeon]
MIKMKTTVSLIKADIGSIGGHIRTSDEILDLCKKKLQEEKGKLLIDFYVTRCGDDVELLMTHESGVDAKEIHSLAWDTFKEGAELAKEQGLYGAGQDLLSDAFSGNVRGMGPGICEMEFEERPAEVIIAFMADKTEASAFNLPLYEMFANPFNTAGLVLDPKLHDGFKFEVHDVKGSRKIILDTPEESYDLLALIGLTDIYAVKRVYRKSGEISAVASTEKVNMIAGRYVGKDDPAMLVRAQSGYPATGEIVNPFARPFFIAGWMRGSHRGPIMPVAEKDANPSRFDGPPRIICLSFSMKNGVLSTPVDVFSDVSFDNARRQANEMADYMRRHGPFQPHLLPPGEMEYTTLPEVMKKLESRFEKL